MNNISSNIVKIRYEEKWTCNIVDVDNNILSEVHPLEGIMDFSCKINQKILSLLNDENIGNDYMIWQEISFNDLEKNIILFQLKNKFHEISQQMMLINLNTGIVFTDNNIKDFLEIEEKKWQINNYYFILSWDDIVESIFDSGRELMSLIPKYMYIWDNNSLHNILTILKNIKLFGTK